MGKNLIIKQFQRARLDEWIGDSKNANHIYEEILKSDNKLSYFLEETIRSRKDSYDKFIQMDFNDMEGIYIDRIEANQILPILSEAKQLYQEEALKPHKNIGVRLEKTNLKYSVSVTAKSGKYLKLEIRGYHPEEDMPDINEEFTIPGWRIKDMDKSKSKKKICRELYLTSKEDNLKVYLTVDQWGLVSGSVIIDEKNLGDALVGIHRMLYELCGKIW